MQKHRCGDGAQLDAQSHALSNSSPYFRESQFSSNRHFGEPALRGVFLLRVDYGPEADYHEYRRELRWWQARRRYSTRMWRAFSCFLYMTNLKKRRSGVRASFVLLCLIFRAKLRYMVVSVGLARSSDFGYHNVCYHLCL